MRSLSLVSVITILAILLGACAPATTVPDTATPAPATATATTPPPTTTPTAEPTTPAELSIREVFEQISPSVAYVDTPLGTGSGVLVREGYLVTNAHVVWPLQTARIVFPDGTEFIDAPVIQWDLMLDLAVIGPLDTSLPPAQFDLSREFAIASDVFLIGYPGEGEDFPTPTISRGLISRLRNWDIAEATYIQTDAAIAGGQSGGVLVSQEGKVIGISGFFFAESFGLALSSADILPRIETLIAGEDPSGLGGRFVLTQGGKIRHEFELENLWDSRTFVVDEPVDTLVSLEATSENDLYVGYTDPYAYAPQFIDDGLAGSESAEFFIEDPGPYFAFVGQYDEAAGDVELTSSHDLVLLDDPDDDTTVSIGDTVVGSIDFPYDLDYFNLELTKGDVVEIVVDSIMVDPYLSVDFPGATEEEMLTDDDSGGGVFDTNARLIYQAPHTGDYYLVVEDSVGINAGGYYLTVSKASDDATPAAKPKATVSSNAHIESAYGSMNIYRSDDYPFSIQYPADWSYQGSDDASSVTALFVDDEGNSLVITEDNLIDVGLTGITLEAYADNVQANIEADGSNMAFEARTFTTLKSGLAAEIIEFAAYDETYRGLEMVYVHQGEIAFNVMYVIPEEQYETLLPTIEYTLNTLTITE